MIPNLESKLKTKSTTQILSLPTMSMLWSLAMHIGDSFLLHPSSLQNPTIILFSASHATSSLRREHYANMDIFLSLPLFRSTQHPPASLDVQQSDASVSSLSVSDPGPSQPNKPDVTETCFASEQSSVSGKMKMTMTPLPFTMTILMTTTMTMTIFTTTKTTKLKAGTPPPLLVESPPLLAHTAYHSPRVGGPQSVCHRFVSPAPANFSFFEDDEDKQDRYKQIKGTNKQSNKRVVEKTSMHGHVCFIIASPPAPAKFSFFENDDEQDHFRQIKGTNQQSSKRIVEKTSMVMYVLHRLFPPTCPCQHFFL